MAGNSLGNGLGIGNGLSAGQSLSRATGLYFAGFVDPSAQAYFNAVEATGTALTDAQKNLINDFFVGLRANNILSKIDGGNILCLTTAAQCYVDFILPSRVATVYSVPTWTFTANRQFMASGSVDTTNLPDAISTGFTPSTAGGQMTQNSAFFGAYRIQNGGTTSTRNYSGANGTNDITMSPRSTGDVFLGRMNVATGDTLLTGITNGTGFFLMMRTAAAETYGQYNSTQGSAVTRASAGLPNAQIRYLQVDGVSAALSTEGIAFGIYGGGGFSLADGAILNTLVQPLITGLRAL
jgi:hypothetical protein